MKRKSEQRPEPHVLPRPEHPISRSAISNNALKVLYRLHRSGFLGYLVGGAVRDLMLGRRPKDFDVGTNARPQQVRRLFKNARLIGRRFRLARVAFSGEVVEVATFRRSPAEDDGESETDALAPIAEPEEYGTPEEDAWRRDFTVNALFYNIADFSIIDHVGGLADLQHGIIRSIGPARQRFLEDPVRMMRAVEYAARLSFVMDNETREAILDMPGEIRRAAPARIAYELAESLQGGQARVIFQGLEEHGLLDLVLPEAGAAARSGGGTLLWGLLKALDGAVERGTLPRDETQLGLLFLPLFLDRLRDTEGRLRHPQVESMVKEVLDEPVSRLALSNFKAHLLRNGFILLQRFSAPPPSGKQVLRTMRQDAFPVAWELAEMLTSVDGRALAGLDAWRTAKTRAEKGMAPVDTPPRSGGEGRRRRRRRPRRRRSS